ncbi:MAG: NAD(P)H-dependent oxidoreductase subunit E [Myxococcota bacterium]
MAHTLSPDAKARIEALTRRYPSRGAALLPALHIAQAEVGCLPLEVQESIASLLGVPPTQVREVVTFYEMYHEHPEGQFHIELCTNLSCHLVGGDACVDHLKQKLGIEVGHHTEDGMFSLMEAECLASCGSGPMMKVGMDYYEGLTPPAIDALIERFKAMAPSLKGKHYEHGPEGAHVGPVRGFEPPKLQATPPVPKPEPPKPAEPAAEGAPKSPS